MPITHKNVQYSTRIYSNLCAFITSGQNGNVSFQPRSPPATLTWLMAFTHSAVASQRLASSRSISNVIFETSRYILSFAKPNTATSSGCNTEVARSGTTTNRMLWVLQKTLTCEVK